MITITELKTGDVLNEACLYLHKWMRKMNNDISDDVQHDSNHLSRLFKLRQHGTDVRTETIAGMTTFLTMV